MEQSTINPARHRCGCLRCGAPLVYHPRSEPLACSYCGQLCAAEASCEAGHFVCDACHTEQGLEVIEQICRTTEETDMRVLLRTIRRHPAMPMHGPEHHALVPAVILASYRNLAPDPGVVDDELLKKVIHRGLKVPGGFCGFAGSCGAAVGVGIAFAALIGATPITQHRRQTALSITAAVLADLAARPAARCCQRESWTALNSAARLSAAHLPVRLRAEASWRCEDSPRNAQCLGSGCPLHDPSRATAT